MFTMRPQPCSRILGSTSWHMRTRPKTLVSNWRRTASIGTDSTAPLCEYPALLTSTPTAPSASSTVWTAADIEFSSVTSRASVRQPAPSRSAIDSGFRAVAYTALPRPGGDDALRRLVGRLFAQRLDRTKPLWELWYVEGLTGGRTALISKTHHSLVDGVSGVDLATVLFDLDPEPRALPDSDVWQPRPEPTGAELAAQSLRSAATAPLRAVARAPKEVEAAREAPDGLGEVVMAGLNPPPDTPLNVRIGPHRRFDVAAASLAEFKEIKGAFGGTVNDVVLAVVAGALQRWFHARGLRTEGLELRAAVPVSLRTSDERGALGNRLTQLVAPLPVGMRDPVLRLKRVSEAMDGVKDSKQALGAEVIAGAQEFAPPTLLAQASRLNFSTRFYNLLVTNVP